MSTNPVYKGDKTLPLQVKNTGFLLDRLGEDCHPLQFLRELTENSIQAMQRNGAPGDIIWDVEWNYLEMSDNAVYKLSVVDTGAGMTGPEMVQYINQLSSSIEQQSLEGNYGIGAKIAAAPKNPEGIIYLSWKDGRGAMIHLWRNPTTGEYGLKQFERGNGEYGHYIEIEDDLKNPIIKDHGTIVVLLGRSPKDDTIQCPQGVPSPSRWISKYLNTRYFRFPEGITVKAREGWEYLRTDSARNKLRTVTGQEKYLNEHSTAWGTVHLTGALAHWWILKDTDAIQHDSNYYASAGHVAALYQDELYEMATGRAGTAKLQQFGVIFGSRQVVIYLGPIADETFRITTNTARTLLLVNSEPLPWADWAAEFRDKMPGQIEALIQEKAAGAAGTDHTKSIRERLKSIIDLFSVSRYRPSAAGPLSIDTDYMVRGGVADSPNKQSGTSRDGGRGGRGGTAGSIYAVFEKKDGAPGERVTPDVFPHVDWISLVDGTREPGDMEDRAARFIMDQNRLLINADFRVYNDMIKKWHKECGGSDSTKNIVRDVVRAWFEQALVETVIGVQALQNSREWSVEDIEKAISEEGLTTAVMQRYHINNQVKRELGSKLGKIAEVC